MKPQAGVTIKKIFNKRNYRPEILRNNLSDSDWSKIYNQNCAEGMFQRSLINFEENRFQDQIKVFNNLESDKNNWNFINEARNCMKPKTEINSLRNSFGDLVTDQTKIANLLNYRFSKLGDYLGKQKPYTENSHDSKTSAPFTFHPISLYECKRHLKTLNKNKPRGPSNIPAWALKDC